MMFDTKLAEVIGTSLLKMSGATSVWGITLGASLGIMLPVSTPPNAIVYGSGIMPITSMIRA